MKFHYIVIPAKAGIQLINGLTQWVNTSNEILSATRSGMTCWIPAFAGMTAAVWW